MPDFVDALDLDLRRQSTFLVFAAVPAAHIRRGINGEVWTRVLDSHVCRSSLIRLATRAGQALTPNRTNSGAPYGCGGTRKKPKILRGQHARRICA